MGENFDNAFVLVYYAVAIVPVSVHHCRCEYVLIVGHTYTVEIQSKNISSHSFNIFES